MLTAAPSALKANDGPDSVGSPFQLGRPAASNFARPAVQTSQRYELTLIVDRAGFDLLEDDWNALFERAGTGTQMFQTFNWLWHWCNHFLGDGAGTRLAIVTARENGRLVLVWPLVSQRAGPITKLAWMGEPVSQYGDVVVDDADSIAILRAAWTFLIEATRADIVQLRKVRADAKVAPFLCEIGATRVELLEAPYLDLTRAKSFADYELKYSKHTRRNRKRQRRRIEDFGPVTVDFYSQGPSARALSGVAIDLKQAWLRERGLISPAVADPATARFFADAVEGHVRPAGCHVMALCSNGAPAALEIGVTCKGRTALHIIVYDRSFEKAGAGAVLMEDSIRRAYQDGAETFDLLAPGDGYKLDWADAATPVSTALVPLTLTGRVYAKVYLELLRGAAKALVTSLPIAWRRRLANQLFLGFAAGRRALAALGGAA